MSKTSKVWSYAKRMDENNAKCKLCEVVESSKGGNTSTLRHHLIGTHHIDLDNIGKNSAANITSFMIAPRPKVTKSRALEIDRKVAKFIARDARPISIIEGDGFISLLKFL